MSAGLPNIEGRLGVYPIGADTASGCFYPLSGFSHGLVGNYAGDSGGFNASLSSSIYGSSTTVTPLSMSCLICISY